MASLSDIRQIVVLMLENRSFDNLFGYMQPQAGPIDGLNPASPRTNPRTGGAPVATWSKDADPSAKTIPDPDPGELFTDISAQLFNGGLSTEPPSMEGFANNYASHGGNPLNIMHGFLPDDLPALTTLANEFALCDRWFASAPCQTWPNRFFVHCATAGGFENNEVEHAPFPMNTIFNELDGLVPWKIYFHDFPQSALLSRLWGRLDNFQLFDRFVADAKSGTLPGYSFIEPMYYPTLTELPNDMHPPHNVGFGDALVAQVYNAVRSSPQWSSTMLIITFDEHGGCYDHVPPPAAVPPSIPAPGQVFAFDRYGVRVPAVVISPFTSPMILRAPAGQAPFDHTSVIKTVRNCFGVGNSLTARDAIAPDLSPVLNAALDPNRGPASLTVTTPNVGFADIKDLIAKPVNDMQCALHAFANRLKPAATSTASSPDEHLADVIAQASSGSSGAACAPTDARPNAQIAGSDARAVFDSILARFGGEGGATPTPLSPTDKNGPGGIYKGH
ncbi:phospholipase C [Pararobbsia alpina]|uniref:alkaline phosphatase family protein n=1 Tax=Pararobbsia alpina TaxID=621374 RepID=UPI0039A77926